MFSFSFPPWLSKFIAENPFLIMYGIPFIIVGFYIMIKMLRRKNDTQGSVSLQAERNENARGEILRKK